MSPKISSIPEELIGCVAGYLNVTDFVSLTRASWKFRRDLQAEATAKQCIEVRSPLSEERILVIDRAQKTLLHSDDGKDDFHKAKQRGFRARLAEIHDCQEAFQYAEPYSLSLMGNATSFVFQHGVLCYATRNGVRILNVRHAGETEKVFSSQFFSDKAIELPETRPLPPPLSLTVLGYENDIMTVMCDFGPAKGQYLFAIDTEDGTHCNRCLLRIRLRSTEQLFVRHNRRYIYYGTLSATGLYDFPEWLVQGYDLSTGRKVNEPTQLLNFAGSELGTSAAFAIHEDYFVAISSQRSPESDEVNWTSYYHYVAFLLDSDDPDIKIKTFYRRQDEEGPINDVWTTLQLQLDKCTGELLVTECRKEWLEGGSDSARACYTQPYERAYHKDWNEEPTVNQNDQISCTVTVKDTAKYEEAPHVRPSKYKHVEFGDSFTGDPHVYLRSKTKWNAYDFHNQCFVDLVVDEREVEGSWRMKERLRLRIVSRRAGSSLEWDGPGAPPQIMGTGELKYKVKPKIRDTTIYRKEIRDSEETYAESRVFMWPGDDVDVPDEVDELMCSGGRAGVVNAEIGEEGIVFLAGMPGNDGERQLVFLSFESQWGWAGMKRVDGTEAVRRERNEEVYCGSAEGGLVGGAGLGKRKGADEDLAQREKKRLKGEDGEAASVAISMSGIGTGIGTGTGTGTGLVHRGTREDSSSSRLLGKRVPAASASTSEGLASRRPSAGTSFGGVTAININESVGNSSPSAKAGPSASPLHPQQQQQQEQLNEKFWMKKARYLSIKKGYWVGGKERDRRIREKAAYGL